MGEQFITVYPNLNVSVKDQKDAQGNVTKVATAKMLSAANGKSRLGATVSVNFSREFAMSVQWQKVDERTGAAIEDEDITDGAQETGGTETGGGSDEGGGGIG